MNEDAMKEKKIIRRKIERIDSILVIMHLLFSVYFQVMLHVD